MDSLAPAPLPSLTQLRLQRANSATGASRLQALERLTGGEQRPSLGRSNTVATAGGAGGDDQGFGVGGGLERRSVVGRRMMERLGNRVAARQQQQQQRQEPREGEAIMEPPQIQLFPPSAFPTDIPVGALGEPRSQSRQTARSVSAAGSDAGSAVFEYDSHLSRNASVRAGKAVAQGEIEQQGQRNDEQQANQAHRVEELLVSPIRAEFAQDQADGDTIPLDPVTPARYTLTDGAPPPISLAPPLEQEPQQTPPRQTLPPQGMRDLPSRGTPIHHPSPSVESILSGTPNSTASSSMIPVMIPPFANHFQPSETRTNPLLPGLGDVAGVSPTRGDRREDSMSRFPQGVGSGTGSGYGFGGSGGGVEAWQEEGTGELEERESGVSDSGGYFERFEEEAEAGDDDARSDVTEKIGLGVSSVHQERYDPMSRSRPGSFMSWEDVGDDSQIQHLPSQTDQVAPPGGVIHRLEQSLRDTWRKHRTSRGESVSSFNDDEGDARHLTSGRVTPLLNSSTNTSTSNMVASYSLLPGQTSPMPAADPHDVRLQNSKLSPFLPTPTPGMGSHFAGFTPGPLLQQASDSLVPTMVGAGLGYGMAGNSTASLPDAGLSASQSSSAAASYYDLTARAEMSSPTPHDAPSGPPGGSGVVGKKSWLAEAFFAGAQGNAGTGSGGSSLARNGSGRKRPSLGDIMKRKPSILERYTERKEQREREKQHGERQELETSRIALAPPVSFGGQRALELSSSQSSLSAPPSPPRIGIPGINRDVSSPRLASESPTVSTVMEAGDERSTVYRPSLSPSAMIGESSDTTPEAWRRRSSVKERLLPSGRMTEMMDKLNAVLALAPDARPDVLDDPPRRLVMSLPVRQVVNLHTVKDRYLFLFSDILVIAKPLPAPETDAGISLDSNFSVKSVVPLQHLKLTADQREHGKAEATPAERHPIVQQFITMFAEDPDSAVELLEQKVHLQTDMLTLASVLFKTAELDKEQLGKYLSVPHRHDLLRAFLERFHFAGLPIDQALRMFLLAIRMPSEAIESETLLHAMADAWYTANASRIAFDASLTVELVMSMVQLNDRLHPAASSDTAYFHETISVDDFVAASHVKDPKRHVPEDLLRSVFGSIKQMPLKQSLHTAEVAEQSRAITLIPGRLPSRLTHKSWSEPIKVCIPEPDPNFFIQLTGNGLVFDPPELDFSMGTVASFRVRGEKLGLRTVLFRRLGLNAPNYGQLANTHTFLVERSFMQHVFHLTFQNHVGLKRKYLYSLQDAETKANTFEILQQLIERTRESKSNWRDTAVMSSASRQLADQISLKVLQSSLIVPGEDVKSSGSRRQKKDLPDGAPSRRPSNPTTIFPTDHPSLGNSPSQQRILEYSISPALEQTYRFDDSASVRDGILANNDNQKNTTSTTLVGSDKLHTGKNIVFICRQNSLLPVVLGFLRHGMPSAGTGPEQLKSIDTPHSAEHSEPVKIVRV